jgi:hypothetical protein
MDANCRLKGLLQQSAGLDLRRIRVVSPVTRLLKLSLVGAFALTAAHDRRHLYQGWEVRKASGFPG